MPVAGIQIITHPDPRLSLGIINRPLTFLAAHRQDRTGPGYAVTELKLQSYLYHALTTLNLLAMVTAVRPRRNKATCAIW